MDAKLRDLVRTAGLDAVVDGDADVAGLSYDHRETGPSHLFCCIPGRTVDGHDFAAQAVASGASSLLVERDIDAGVPTARVATVREALGPLADAFHGSPSSHLDVAAVTGTNGKTTVTYLLEAIGRAAGLTPGVIGTIRYQIGHRRLGAIRTTPEAIDLQRMLAEMRAEGCRMAVVEAASEAIAQHRMRSTRVACAAFTNLSQDHLNFHGDMESYYAAKRALFDAAWVARAAINTDDPYGRRLAEEVDVPTLTFGTEADVTAIDVAADATGTSLTISTPDGAIRARTALPGAFNVSNALCAAAVAISLDIDAEHIAAGLQAVDRVPGRLDRVDAGQPFTVLVDYAHTPTALEAALDAARSLTANRVIAVIGCGGDRDRDKRPLMGRAATSRADLTVVTSDNPRSEAPLAIIEDIRPGAEAGGGSYTVEPDRRAAIEAALAAARPGDVVVIAGKGHERGQTIGDTTLPFDDHQVTSELLAGMVPCPD